MATKRSVVLAGTPEFREVEAATEEIRPGYLVKTPVGAVSKQTVSNQAVPKSVAVERDELGAGFDNTYQTDAAVSAFYASGDCVKIADFGAGMRATMYIASGQNVQKDELLASAGDGTLKVVTDGTAIAVSEEEVGAVTELTPIAVRFI